MAKEQLIEYSDKQKVLMRSEADTTLYGGARGGGKANPVTADIYTPFGVKKMGDIGIGDMVCTPNGRNAKVIGVYPQGKKNIYKFTMQDGGVARATKDHLWKYSIANHQWRKSGREWKIATTEQLIDMMNDGKRIMLPVTEPVQFTRVFRGERVLDSYLLGLLLGDGCMTGSGRVGIVTEDDEIVTCLKGHEDYFGNSGNNYIFNNNGEVENGLRSLGLYGKYSYNKFIPESYLWYDKENRWKLLRGLMDTDGCASKDGKAYYTTVSKQLAEDVRFLIKSLGGRCTITEAVKGYRKDNKYHECRKAYRLYIRMRDNSTLFRLSRKRERGGLNNGGSLLKNKIVSIELDGQEEAQCIKLDSLEELYLTDDFIVTHNTFGIACKMALDICEDYTEAGILDKGHRRDNYRTYVGSDNVKHYYRMLIDYPFYRGIVVRRTEPELMETIKPECQKIYPHFGGKWNQEYRKWKFPSGAEIIFRPAHRREDLDFFQSGNFQRLWIAELTQFKHEFVEKIEGCVRTAYKMIPARKIYDTNPGGIGHRWVKKEYIDTCGWKSGDLIYNEQFDIEYRNRLPKDEYYENETGETYTYIPSTVFDNPFIMKNDPNYVRNLKKKNEILMRMWLLGDWNVFAGQFFDMWDETKHIMDEKKFFGAKTNVELVTKKRHFDWGNYTLFRAFDYGFKAPWCCQAFALDNKSGDVYMFAEIYETGLTSKQQARKVNEFFYTEYNLKNKDFTLNFADPKSYWKRQEKGDDFIRPKKYFADAGIHLTRANNNRVQGAGQVAEFLRIRKDGTPRLAILSNCINTIETLPNLPSDDTNPEDVDTNVEDHSYDSLRYFLTHFLPEAKNRKQESENKGWRERLWGKEGNRSGNNMWKVS